MSLLVWIAVIQGPGKGVTTSPTVTEDELRLLAYRAAHEGQITEDDPRLIERAFRFGNRRADDIMVPRPDIVAVEASASIDEAIEVALESGHRRIPVYRDTLEHIIGVVRLRELTEARKAEDHALTDIATEPLVVPESKRMTSLLACRLLSPGDDVEIEGYRLTADSVRRRRIIKVRIEKLLG